MMATWRLRAPFYSIHKRFTAKIAFCTLLFLLLLLAFLVLRIPQNNLALNSILSPSLESSRYEYGIHEENNLPENDDHVANGHNNGLINPNEKIPNIAHFTYILRDPAADFNFQFSHYLSVYAAWYFDRPHSIYLSTNANNESITRAMDGRSGKWNKGIFNMPGMKINRVIVPKRAKNGVRIQDMEHKSDFVRVKAMHELGGVYRDFDVHTLRPLKPLLQSGFSAVVGRANTGIVNSGIFLSAAGGNFISMWMQDMHKDFDGSWARHSDGTITRLCGRLVRHPAEVLIMERDAFAPGGWYPEAYTELFENHGNMRSNLDTIKQGDALPLHEEKFAERWNHPDRFADWEKDYSSTYLLHAFSPVRSGFKVEGFDHITPRYVLERKSNYARATYPVAKIMYDQGLIEINDSHQG